jgi:hypothetical protein
VTLALLSALVYVGVVAYAATRETSLAPVLAIVGAVGALLLAVVLVRRQQELLGWALGLAGGVYAVALLVHGTHVDEAAPLVGAGLLLCGELATWSADEHPAIPAERGVAVRRAAAVAGLAFAGLAVAALVVSVAAVPVGGGLVWTIVGAAAAVLVVAFAARLSRGRWPDD